MRPLPLRPISIATLAAALLACHPAAPAQPAVPTAPTPSTAEPGAAARPVPRWASAILPKDAGGPALEHVRNLERLPELTAAQREHLARDGFFVAQQPGPKARDTSAAHARTGARAKHLFQVYERNDYVRFPSYVTVDVAIDLTHQYFDVVLRRLEREHLSPMLHRALRELLQQAERQLATAKKGDARTGAHAAAVFWGTALHLLEQPAAGDKPDEIAVKRPWVDPDAPPEPAPTASDRPPPTKLSRAIRDDVAANVAAIHAASGKRSFPAWGLELDLTQTKPRSHYADDGVLQRYFRAMSLIGMASFAVTGEAARPATALALVRSYAAAKAAHAPWQSVLEISNFIVGAPPTAGLAQATARVGDHDASLLAAPLERWLAAQPQILAAWQALPAHPIDSQRGPVIEPLGKRVFVDTLAMSQMLPLATELSADRGDVLMRMMGAAGAAAVLGDPTAGEIAAGDDPKIAQALLKGRARIAGLDARDDAYHRTLDALTGVLGSDATWFEPHAWQRRGLQSFAGGWAMLRHDTLLYAYEMGAECDAEEFPAPHGWVEPMPQVYADLRAMVERFGARLEAAGIVEREPAEDEYGQFHTVRRKTEAIAGFLRQLEAWSAKELRGEPFTPEERTAIATVGGFAEHVLLTFADAYELGDGNDDMAVIADVFTWRGQALEVGVGHPELIYALVPTPEGWMVARGAVLGYREFLVPAAARMTDETWRRELAASGDFLSQRRPQWLAPITAEPVAVIELPPKLEAQSRCEYFGGAFEL